jgi:hypothetical protein
VTSAIAAAITSYGVERAVQSGTCDPIVNIIVTKQIRSVAALSNIAENLPESMEGLDFSPIVKSLGGLGDAVADAFETIFGEIDLTTPDGLHEVFHKIINGFAGLIDVTKGIIEGLRPLFEDNRQNLHGMEKWTVRPRNRRNCSRSAKRSISLRSMAGLLWEHRR